MKADFDCTILTVLAVLAQVTAAITLESSSSSILERLQALEDEVSSLRSQLKNSKECDNNQAIQSRSKRSVSDRQVAFHVTHAEDDFFVIGSRMKFTTITTEVNAPYDPTTGHFRCSVPGTYLFSISVMAANNRRVEAGIIRRRGRSQPTLLAQTVSDFMNGTSHGAGSVIVDLWEGDLVYVDVLSTNGLVRLVGDHMTSFSGHLLFPY